jgi:DNA-binding NarL/FixJ family response regulator
VTTPIRIVVVDDHRLFRSGVVELLQTVAGFEIAAEGASGSEAITLAHELRPDVILLDIEMPGPGAAATVRKILQSSPGTRVVVLTMHDDADRVRDVFEVGASGYLIKSAGRTELIAAINTAFRNEGSVLMSVSRNTVIALGHGSTPPPPSLLSARETEVLKLLANADANRDIAKALYISEGTVKRHLANIYAKLGASSRIDAVRKATQLGILTNTFASDALGES